MVGNLPIGGVFHLQIRHYLGLFGAPGISNDAFNAVI